VEPKFEA
jgi:hypothetical protein